jgi:sulfate transport system permease protein
VRAGGSAPLVVGVGAYLGVVLVVPLLALLFTVVTHLGEVVGQLATWPALHAMWLSGMLAILALILNGTFGVIGALVLVRQEFWGRRILDALVDLPLAISPVMTGLAFTLLFGRTGWFHPILEFLSFKVTYAFPGLLLATLFVTLPFTVREVALVLEELGTTEEDAAATLGASAWQAFWRITFPNIRHGLGLGLTLTVARALGEFGAVLVLGGAVSGKTQTATTFIHAAMDERHEPAAYGMALLLAAAAAALLVFLQRQKGH